MTPTTTERSAHRAAVERLTKELARSKPDGWRVRVQLPIALTNSVPEPDAFVLRGDEYLFDSWHPNAADFGIVIEVSDSTLELDRAGKGRIYARAGIPVYWIVNVADKQVDVYTDPDASGYKTRTDYAPGVAVPITRDGAALGTIPVNELVP